MELATDAGASAPANEPAVAPQPVTIVDNSPPSIDDTMEAAWAEIEKRDKESQEGATDRPRDASGKFISTKPEGSEQPAEASEAAPEGEAPEADAAKDSAETQPATGAAQPPPELPPTYSAEMKAKFAKLPAEFRDVQEYIAKRDGQQNDAIVRLQDNLRQQEQFVKSFDDLSRTILAYKDDFARRGITATQGIANLLAVQKSLEQQPFNTWVEIGRRVGIDLGQILQTAGIDPRTINIQPQQPNQEVSALQAELRNARAEVAEVKRRLEHQDHSAQQWELSQANQAITDFAKDKPYFEQVREDMAVLLQTGRAATLADAYTKACRMNDTVAAKLQEDERKAGEEKRKAEEKAKKAEEQAKAEAARKSAAVNVKSVPAKSNPKTLDDELREGINRLYG
jgi:hypothetical protein